LSYSRDLGWTIISIFVAGNTVLKPVHLMGIKSHRDVVSWSWQSLWRTAAQKLGQAEKRRCDYCYKSIHIRNIYPMGVCGKVVFE